MIPRLLLAGLSLLFAAGCGPTPTTYDDLWDALRAGDAADVARHLRNGTPIESDGPGDGLTPFQVAVGSGKLDCAALLLKRGARINPAPGSASDIRLLAVQSGDTSMVGWLVRKGLEFAELDTANLSPLMAAASLGDTLMCRTLVDYHCSLMGAPANLWPLHLAAAGGHLATVQLLVSLGCPVDGHRSDDGTTALWFAALKQRGDVVEWLLSQGADPLGGRERGDGDALQVAGSECHALLRAADNPNLIAEQLLVDPVPVSAPARTGKTVPRPADDELLLAIAQQDTAALARMVPGLSSIDAPVRGHTLSYWSRRDARIVAYQWLLRHGAADPLSYPTAGE